jgi:hypothetical protein
MLKRLKKLFGWNKIENALITPYRSYGTKHHLYLLGRALDDIPLKIVENQSFFNTLKNTYKQFDSFEIPKAKVELNIPELIGIFYLKKPFQKIYLK